MKNLLQKLLAVSKEIEPMEKDGKNTAQGYKYLSEAKVKLNIRDLLNKYGVVFIHSSKIDDFTQISTTSRGTPNWATKVHVDYKFYDAETGEMLDGWYEAHGVDTGDKGAFKATTGAVKNILMQNFLIPTGDDPERDEQKTSKSGNTQSPARSPKAQSESPHELSKEQVEDILKSGNFKLATGITKSGKNQGKPWYALDYEGQRGWLKEATYNFIQDNFELGKDNLMHKKKSLVNAVKEVFGENESSTAKANRATVMNL